MGAQREGRGERAHGARSAAAGGRLTGASDIVSGGNGEHGTGHWSKGGPRHKVAKNLAKTGSNVLWRVELVKH